MFKESAGRAKEGGRKGTAGHQKLQGLAGLFGTADRQDEGGKRAEFYKAGEGLQKPREGNRSGRKR